MADISFHRGKKSAVNSVPIKDGQFLVGAVNGSRLMTIYADMKDENGNITRFSLDLTDFIKRIEYLEDEIELLNLVLQKDINIANLHTDDDQNIVTDNDEKILYIRYEDPVTVT